MSIGIGSIGNTYFSNSTQSSNTINANKLKNKINSIDKDTSSDEELKEVCKEFEAYLMEQVVSKMKDTTKVFSDEEENDNVYMNYFGDYLYKDYAKKLVDSGGFGLADKLYESMKR